MKLSRKLTALFLMIVIVVNFSILGGVETLAHETILNVEYDACDDYSLVDWIDEDIQAYIEGTLIFYAQNDTPEAQ